MGITDELREYAGSFYLFRYKDVREKLDAIADRIDAEHQKAIRELNNLADASMLLPVDADGEIIHVGDVMVYADGNTCPLPVVAIVSPAVFLTDEGPRYADMCRHAPDTWERIITDAINMHFNPSWISERDALVARCKALAGN